MKNTIVVLFILTLFMSCGGTKRAVENAQKITEVVPPTPPKQPEQPKQPVTPKTPNSVEKIEPTSTEPIQQPTTDTIVTEDVEATTETTKEAFNHSAWNTLLQQYVSNKGNVDYKGLKTNRKALTQYITSLSDNMPNNTWTKADKLAYWINAYNAMTVDLILRNFPIESIKDIDNPWDKRLWKLGDKWYNLDDIEHQILRKMNEPRIHFGIVCASYSCPKLINTAFTASNLDTQLTEATKGFLSDPERNNLSTDRIQLSKIFKWFAKDFKTEGSLIDFLNKYSDISISNTAKKSYKDYNWRLNN